MEFAFILPVKKISAGCNNINSISQALFIIKSDNEFSSKSQKSTFIYSNNVYERFSMYLELGLLDYCKTLTLMESN